MNNILKEIRGRDTCTAALIIRNGKILLGFRNYSHNIWTGGSTWTTPGGRCEGDETLEESIKRETLEETGITDLDIKEHLGTVDGAKKGDKVEVFLCASKQEPKLTEPDKFSEWKWFNLQEMPDKFINKNILSIIQEKL